MQGELVVANVFVRVYNEQPAFQVTDPATFCKGLVTYLHAKTLPAQSRPQPPESAAETGRQCFLGD
jgi:DnaJ family protein C protein 13